MNQLEMYAKTLERKAKELKVENGNLRDKIKYLEIEIKNLRDDLNLHMGAARK